MASLQRIRNHGVLLLVIVGLAMLAFILGDFFNSGSSFFNRSREYVGEIAGQGIHITDYENAREQLSEVYKIESGRSDFDEDMQSQISNQAWQMMVLDHSLEAQAEKSGMTVTADELSELCIGDNIHQLIRQRRAFADENGQFSRVALIRFLAGLEEAAKDNNADQNVRQAQSYWMYWENAVRLTWLQEKYTDLLQELVGANDLDARAAADARNVSVNADYVCKPYYAVPDSTVKVSSADLSKLYKKQKDQYKQEPNRTLQYVTFTVLPSEQDFAEVENWIHKLQAEFTETSDLAGMVNSNSDVLYKADNYSQTTIPALYRDWAFAKERKAGDVTDIIFDNDTYSIARIVETGYSLPDSVEIRFTILADAAQLDSLKAEWKAGRYGDAQEAGWLTEKAMPREMADKAFTAAKNEIITMDYGTGLQVAQIMNKAASTPKVKMAVLARTVTPSSRTYASIYNEAKQFVVSNHDAEQFTTAAGEQGLQIQSAYNLQKNTAKVNDLTQSRPVVRWAFKAKEGEVSDVFECGEQFVVAFLDEVHDGDYRSLAEVTPELRMQALRDKKAESVIASLKGVSTLEDAARILDAEVQTADDITLGSYRFGSAGTEPAVIGKAVTLAQGEVSEPVKGQNGVYVVRVTEKTVAPEAEPDLEQEKQQIAMRYMYSLPYQALNLVEEAAKVTDNRANFY